MPFRDSRPEEKRIGLMRVCECRAFPVPGLGRRSGISRAAFWCNGSRINPVGRPRGARRDHHGAIRRLDRILDVLLSISLENLGPCG